MAPSTSVPDDNQQYDQGRTECHEDRNSVKQFLISSYKKNLHPLIKDDIHRNIHDPVRAIRGPQSSRCKFKSTFSFKYIVIIFHFNVSHDLGH